MPAYTTGRDTRRRAAADVAATATLVAIAGFALFGFGDASASAAPDAQVEYGAPITLGQGRARTYVIHQGGAPVEIGVALDERALDGLPAPGSGHAGAHGEMHEHLLQLPRQHGTPFRFVELDWNPGGHEPPGVYDAPHFDFHFYTIHKAARDAIDPRSNRHYADEANHLPAADLTPPHYALPLPPGTPPVVAAVPRMGVHLVDMRTPEIQKLLGNPRGYRPFTTTFIHGAWDGRITFFEPMVTRAHILARKAEADPAARDQIIPLPAPQRYGAPGHYPAAYRIAWNAQAGEYRIALTQLSARP